MIIDYVSVLFWPLLQSKNVAYQDLQSDITITEVWHTLTGPPGQSKKDKVGYIVKLFRFLFFA